MSIGEDESKKVLAEANIKSMNIVVGSSFLMSDDEIAKFAACGMVEGYMQCLADLTRHIETTRQETAKEHPGRPLLLDLDELGRVFMMFEETAKDSLPLFEQRWRQICESVTHEQRH